MDFTISRAVGDVVLQLRLDAFLSGCVGARAQLRVTARDAGVLEHDVAVAAAPDGAARGRDEHAVILHEGALDYRHDPCRVVAADGPASRAVTV